MLILMNALGKDVYLDEYTPAVFFIWRKINEEINHLNSTGYLHQQV